MRSIDHSSVLLVSACAVALLSATPSGAARFEIARIYIEYNESANDLGFHVSVDAEDWESLEIADPSGATIFTTRSSGGYAGLGLTELFFEGAEPSLADVPLGDLLARFPEGKYQFVAVTADGKRLSASAVLSHAIPAGPAVSAVTGNGSVTISWTPVSAPAAILPDHKVAIVGYQVLVGAFQVTLPATATHATLPPEFVASLPSGRQPFEVLAIEAGGNQTITEGTFVRP